MKKKNLIIIVVLSIFVVIMGVLFAKLAWPLITEPSKGTSGDNGAYIEAVSGNEQTSSNNGQYMDMNDAHGQYGEEEKDENGLKKFIKKTKNKTNGYEYSFELDDASLDEIPIGKQIETADYIYTYGYYWSDSNPANVAVFGSYEGWTLQPGNIGWGVSIKDRAKGEYSDMYDVIGNKPVTWLNGTFYNSVMLKDVPHISVNATHTAYCFYNCINITKVQIPSGLGVVGKLMFYHCTRLTDIYLPKSVEYLSADFLQDSNVSLKIYCEAQSAPANWEKGFDCVDVVTGVPAFIKYGVTQEQWCALTHDGYCVFA